MALDLVTASALNGKPYNDGFPLTTVVGLRVAPDRTLLAATKGRGVWRVLTGP